MGIAITISSQTSFCKLADDSSWTDDSNSINCVLISALMGWISMFVLDLGATIKVDNEVALLERSVDRMVEIMLESDLRRLSSSPRFHSVFPS